MNLVVPQAHYNTIDSTLLSSSTFQKIQVNFGFHFLQDLSNSNFRGLQTNPVAPRAHHNIIDSILLNCSDFQKIRVYFEFHFQGDSTDSNFKGIPMNLVDS